MWSACPGVPLYRKAASCSLQLGSLFHWLLERGDSIRGEGGRVPAVGRPRAGRSCPGLACNHRKQAFHHAATPRAGRGGETGAVRSRGGGAAGNGPVSRGHSRMTRAGRGGPLATRAIHRPERSFPVCVSRLWRGWIAPVLRVKGAERGASTPPPHSPYACSRYRGAGRDGPAAVPFRTRAEGPLERNGRFRQNYLTNSEVSR